MKLNIFIVYFLKSISFIVTLDDDDEPPMSSIDEDKLVQQLVQVLCQKGDEYTRSIDVSQN